MKNYYSLFDTPSDDAIRYILQFISTEKINQLLRSIHCQPERKKLLKSMRFMRVYDLISLDGTDQLSSYKISFSNYLTRVKDKKTLFMHGQLVASLIDVKAQYSLTLQFEPIENDGKRTDYQKNDCELNAAKRLLKKIKTNFPKRNFCFVADNLMGVVPIVNEIRRLGWHFIITAKPERNEELFFMLLKAQKKEYEFVDKHGHLHKYL